MAQKKAKENGRAVEVVASGSALRLVNKEGITMAMFPNLMGALMRDLLGGKLQPQVANSVCRAGELLLRAEAILDRRRTINVEAQQRDS